MKRKALLIFAAITFAACAKAAPAAGAKVQTPEKTVLSAPAQSVPNATQTPAVPLSPAESARQLMENVKEAYGAVRSYSISFDLMQLLKPANNTSESQKKDITDTFDLMYLAVGPDNHDYLMRLSAVKGHHHRTVVVYAKDKNGKYTYTVYKPSGRVVVKPEDARVTDLPLAELHSIIADIDASLAEDDAIVKVEKLASGIVLMVTKEAKDKEMLTGFGSRSGIQVSQFKGIRATTYFDPVTFYLKKQDIEIKGRSGYLLKQSIEWHGFKPNDKIKPGDITAAPAKL